MPRWKEDIGRDHTDADPGDPALHHDLKRVLDRVGPSNYARATAREFRPGGRFNPRARKQRYAIT